ncbi:hypothetical protein GRI39_02765 [Altererythrobacter indicus]|uniref:Uncharacterized protein n=1 Tax=Altericroceibacterium indicum TaxID=374177 RepID=A0A845A6H8_9SPHN|nr:hypothetical protein [Altericroceibacterium indicum]MXP24969.1 hypothetical protein [Altericroceibacterium indicum]
MTIALGEQKKLHYDLTDVGLRAQATAVGLLQLCLELRKVDVLSDAAIDRIKEAITDEIVVCAPRAVNKQEYRRDARARLDRLFAGEQKMGSADELAPQHS